MSNIRRSVSRVALSPQEAFKGKRMVYLSRDALAKQTGPWKPFLVLPSGPEFLERLPRMCLR